MTKDATAALILDMAGQEGSHVLLLLACAVVTDAGQTYEPISISPEVMSLSQTFANVLDIATRGGLGRARPARSETQPWVTSSWPRGFELLPGV